MNRTYEISHQLRNFVFVRTFLLTFYDYGPILLCLWFLPSFFMFTDGSLTISSGESLVINTSTGRAQHLNHKEYQLHFLHFSYKQWNYSVAQLAFKGYISFVKGSIVRLAGSNPLSIKSENGNILTQTLINVTCTTLGRENETCLGGYTVSASPKENGFGRMIYTGAWKGNMSAIWSALLLALC